MVNHFIFFLGEYMDREPGAYGAWDLKGLEAAKLMTWACKAIYRMLPPSVIFPLPWLFPHIFSYQDITTDRLANTRLLPHETSLAWGLRGMGRFLGFHGNHFRNPEANLVVHSHWLLVDSYPPSEECCSCCPLLCLCYPQGVSPGPFYLKIWNHRLWNLRILSTLGSFFGLKSR